MNFEIPKIHGKSATIKVDYRILRELLRLPPSVEITYAFPSDGSVVLTVTGAVPEEGELTADYVYEHHTVVKFQGFRKP